MANSEPNVRELADLVVARLRLRGNNSIELNLPEKEVIVHDGQYSGAIFLGNLLRECQSTDAEDRVRLVDRFLDTLSEARSGPELTFETARARLMPVVRDVYGISQFPVRHRLAPGEDTLIASRPFVGDMVVTLAVDMPTSLLLVPTRMLAEWGRTFDECYSIALENLRKRSAKPVWQQVTRGIFDASWGDSYDSSRILLPELIDALPVRNPVAMVPFRDSLLVTSADNPQGVALMARFVVDVVRKQNRWLSFRLLRRDGEGWAEAPIPRAAREPLRELELGQLAGAYEALRSRLSKEAADGGEDIFVATLRLGRQGSGPVTSMAMWTRGVATLLPRADHVVLSVIAETEVQAAIVPWEAVSQHLGAYLEATDYLPPLFRTKGFPSFEEVAALPGARVLPKVQAGP